ncbi:MAG: winged helix-turn-helix domain-containing protein, partial [Gammaproteobacteria bacterium]|nr:winged helix-turn-helix domain-containing protein [Gammaproteobacteria bacterium]
MRFVFDDYELDATRFELRHKGVPTALEPQVFDLLNYLVKNNTRIISKQELMDKLWAGKIVSESTLTSCIKAARKAIGDDGQSQRYISTLHRRGYRFVGPLQTEAPPVAQKPGETGDLITQGALASSEEIGEACLFPIPPAPKEKRITIVVLPISTQENETVQFFAQALFDDMNIQLARTPGFLVVSRNSANYFRQSGSDAKQIALDTGAHYLVDGTIQSSGDTVHLSLKLLETEQGTVIWGLRKNIPIQQLNELQQEIIL